MANGLHQLLADHRRVLVALLALDVKDIGALFHQLSFPVANQCLMYFELGGELGKLLLALNRRNGDPKLELFGVVISRSFAQLQSPSQHQADKLTSLSSPVGPLYNLL